MDEVQAAELQAALNRLEPLVVRRAIDALRHHALSKHYRIQSFATGAASAEDVGTKISATAEGNYLFRVTFADSAAGFDFSGSRSQPSFIELTLSRDSLTWFAAALREALEKQGFRG